MTRTTGRQPTAGKAVVLLALRSLQAARMITDRDQLNTAYYALTGQPQPATSRRTQTTNTTSAGGHQATLTGGTAMSRSRCNYRALARCGGGCGLELGTRHACPVCSTTQPDDSIPEARTNLNR